VKVRVFVNVSLPQSGQESTYNRVSHCLCSSNLLNCWANYQQTAGGLERAHTTTHSCVLREAGRGPAETCTVLAAHGPEDIFNETFLVGNISSLLCKKPLTIFFAVKTDDTRRNLIKIK
jgi:hypothetical protein